MPRLPGVPIVPGPIGEIWRAGQDSNLRPSAPEADALSTELPARGERVYPTRADWPPSIGEGPSEEGPSVAAGFANRKGIFHERFPALPLPKPTHGLAISGESLCEQPQKDTRWVGYGSTVGG